MTTTLNQNVDRPVRTAVAFLGIGNMAEAVLAGALRGGHEPGAVRVTARRQERVDHVVERYGVAGTTDNREAAARVELVILGVEPDQVGGVLEEIADTVTDTSVLVSLAGGVSITDLESHLPQGTAVVRVMPNTSALVGQGMAALTPGTHCTSAQLQKVAEFFEQSGDVVIVPEEQQRAVGAISGSGPAYYFYVVDAMIEAGVSVGLRRDLAHRLAVQTIVGAGAVLKETGDHPVVLRERVSSPGGTTIAALNVLDDRAVRASLISAATSRFRR